MHLEDFIKNNENKSILEKIKLLYDTTEIKCRREHDAYEASIRGNQNTAYYLRDEADVMEKRIEWIYSSIKEDLIKAGLEAEKGGEEDDTENGG